MWSNCFHCQILAFFSFIVDCSGKSVNAPSAGQSSAIFPFLKRKKEGKGEGREGGRVDHLIPRSHYFFEEVRRVRDSEI